MIMWAAEWSGQQKAEGARRLARMLSEKGGQQKPVVWMERTGRAAVRSHVVELVSTGLDDERNLGVKEGKLRGIEMKNHG